MEKLSLHYGVHWLSFLWECNSPEELECAVRIARSAGATRFELIYHILNKLTAEQTASALKKSGMDHAMMCMFFPSDGEGGYPMGDPLSADSALQQQAVDTFEQVLRFIGELRLHGINIDLIGGPSCYVLGKDYGFPDDYLHDLIAKFYRQVGDALRRLNVGVSIELLRQEEDGVVKNPDNLALIIDHLKTEIIGTRFGAHYDTFHFDRRGYDQVSAIRTLGNRITHLHLNGSGRLPPGYSGDTIDWALIIPALKNVGLDGLTTTYEPFCADVREACPPLGVGLPEAVDEPAGIVQTFKYLTRLGVDFIQE